MAEPNWELWEHILRGLQTDMSGLRDDMDSVKTQLKSIADEVKGLKRMSQMALGTASGADFVAERAEKLATDTNKRLDDLIASLKRQDIHVDA